MAQYPIKIDELESILCGADDQVAWFAIWKRRTRLQFTPIDIPKTDSDVDQKPELRIRRRRPAKDPEALVSLAQVEKAHIQRVLNTLDNNSSRAAEVLELNRTTLIAKIRKYGLS